MLEPNAIDEVTEFLLKLGIGGNVFVGGLWLFSFLEQPSLQAALYIGLSISMALFCVLVIQFTRYLEKRNQC